MASSSWICLSIACSLVIGCATLPKPFSVTPVGPNIPEKPWYLIYPDLEAASPGWIGKRASDLLAQYRKPLEWGSWLDDVKRRGDVRVASHNVRWIGYVTQQRPGSGCVSMIVFRIDRAGDITGYEGQIVCSDETYADSSQVAQIRKAREEKARKRRALKAADFNWVRVGTPGSEVLAEFGAPLDVIELPDTAVSGHPIWVYPIVPVETGCQTTAVEFAMGNDSTVWRILSQRVCSDATYQDGAAPAGLPNGKSHGAFH